MAQVRSFRTFVELDERNLTANSVRARLDAVLDDGTYSTLLDDRGWAGGHIEDWTIAQIELTARTVVGPDEAMVSRGETAEQMAEGYRQGLQDTLSRAGFDVANLNFDALPNVVELGPRLLARLDS